MKLFASLKNRIFLACALVAVLSIGFAMRFVTASMAGEAEAELRRGLQRSAALVEENHAARLNTLTLLARLIADLPKLKAALATGDPPTLLPIASDYRERVKADLFTVGDRKRVVLVSLGGAGGETADAAAVRSALAGHEATTFQATPNGVLEVVTVPVVLGPDPPEVLGTLSMGFALNDAHASEFKAVTESDLVFALDGRARASTLPGAGEPALARVLQSSGIVSISVGGSEYVALARALQPAAGGSLVAVVLRSRTERLAFLRTLRAALVGAGIVAVVVAVILSYGVARTVTRPVAAITAVMRDIAATGDLTRRIGLRGQWGDEDATLLATTFNTLTESITRFQGESALRDRLSALGRLSTVIAHEVRNPLMIIKTSLSALRRRGASAAEIGEAAADIDHEVRRLNRIVDDVLDFARPVRLEPAPVDVNALCQDAVGASVARDAGIRVRLALDSSLPLVATDGDRLRTVLVNILENACDAVLARGAAGPAAPAAPAAGSGEDAPDIELRTRFLGGDRLVIEVEDRGMGISPEDLQHIFEPYFTTKRTGTGLGLAIAKNIVDSMRGTLTIRSRPGEGSELRIELRAPAVAAEGGAAASLARTGVS